MPEQKLKLEKQWWNDNIFFVLHHAAMEVLQFKVFHPKREKTLDETMQTALQQIEDRQYEQTMGFYRNISVNMGLRSKGRMF